MTRRARPALQDDENPLPVLALEKHRARKETRRPTGSSSTRSSAPTAAPTALGAKKREQILDMDLNHRMAGVGRDLGASSGPTPLLKQGHLQQAAQDLVQAGFEYLQRGRLHSPSGQPVPVLHHPQREEVLPHVQTELPVLQFVPVAPCRVAGHR